MEQTKASSGSESNLSMMKSSPYQTKSSNRGATASSLFIKNEPTTSLMSALITTPAPSLAASVSNQQPQLQQQQQLLQPDIDHDANAQIFNDAKLLEDLLLNSPSLNQPPSTSIVNNQQQQQFDDPLLSNVNILDDSMIVDMYNN